MSSSPPEQKSRFRKNVEDATVFAGAITVSVGAILQFGVVGLAAGCLVLSLAAAVVVSREEGFFVQHDERPVVTDGGRDR
jgi:hypothetical protein